MLKKKLKNGDIILFVSKNNAVDYAHLGMINKRSGKAILRHAKYNKTIKDDTLLSEYIKDKPFLGISVARLKKLN